MQRFARLFESLDRTTSTTRKVGAISQYFRETPPDDACWALYFLTGSTLKRTLSATALARWVRADLDLPDWLFAQCYEAVGDLAETIALTVDTLTERSPTAGSELGAEAVSLSAWVQDRLVPLRSQDAAAQRAAVLAWLRELPQTERFLLVKLITGSLRVGVSKSLVQRAVAEAFGLPTTLVAHRLAGDWQPSAAFFAALTAPEGEAGEGATATSASRPYPFFLASPVETAVDTATPLPGGSAGPDLVAAALGPVSDYVVEWKWDGIRAQIIRRGHETFVWSRGDELLTERFPELLPAAARLPEGTVIDGEILAFQSGRPMPFAVLQKRIGRAALDRRILARAPVALIAYDLIERDGHDLRQRTLRERRGMLEELFAGLPASASAKLTISESLAPDSWAAAAVLRGKSRERGVEGLMLKHLNSVYGTGRTRATARDAEAEKIAPRTWWKWKIEPHTFDGVLVAAEPGHGRRASLLSDYTFAVWDGAALVPVARAYSGLTNEEVRELDAWIRAHTTGRFGPVRAVEPARVFEIAFEAIARSTRHRGGVAVRFPRILRARADKTVDQADTLKTLLAMIPPEEKPRQGELFGESR
jgi:DNA ligase 1